MCRMGKLVKASACNHIPRTWISTTLGGTSFTIRPVIWISTTLGAMSPTFRSIAWISTTLGGHIPDTQTYYPNIYKIGGRIPHNQTCCLNIHNTGGGMSATLRPVAQISTTLEAYPCCSNLSFVLNYKWNSKDDEHKEPIVDLCKPEGQWQI